MSGKSYIWYYNAMLILVKTLNTCLNIFEEHVGKTLKFFSWGYQFWRSIIRMLVSRSIEMEHPFIVGTSSYQSSFILIMLEKVMQYLSSFSIYAHWHVQFDIQ
jgi:hypothetical protein